MTQSTIDIPGLPEGWKAVAYKIPVKDVDWILSSGRVKLCKFYPLDCEYLIVEKTTPRRIVLEETDEERSVSYGDWYEDDLGRVNQWLNKSYGSPRCVKIWRIVEEE